MEISKLKITGPLTESTPFELVLEVADSYNFQYTIEDLKSKEGRNKLINNINTSPIKKIIKPYSTDDYKYIIQMINPEVDWTTLKLEEALQYFLKFEDKTQYMYILDNFKYGIQTPDNIHLINNCLVYALCIHYNLKLTEEMKIDEMVEMFKRFLKDKDSIILKIDDELKKLEINDLIKIYYKIKYKKL